MQVYLVRHGESEIAGSDDERPLNDKGIQDVNKLAEFISHRIVVSHIFSSKKMRARQTAEILANMMPIKVQLKQKHELEPLNSVEPIQQEIDMLVDDTIYVGHIRLWVL